MSNRWFLHGLVIFAFMVTSSMADAPESHPFSVHDMLAMERISDPHLSPDGQRIVFVLRTTDLESNRGRTDLWVVNGDGSGLRRLTTNPASDSNPRWSRDGQSVYFLTTRSDLSQIWRITVDGGEAEQVTHQPIDVGSFILSPTGGHLAMSMEVFPGLSVEETKKRLDETASRKESGRIYDKLFVRHWDAWKDGRRAHLFVMPVQGGTPVDIMKDMDADCPTKPFGGIDDYTFTPDGQSIVFTAKDEGRNEAWSTNYDLFVAPADASSKPDRLTAGNPAWDAQPLFSPDGTTLAYRAMKRAGYEADCFDVHIMDWASRSVRRLDAFASNWDRSAGSLTWSPDGSTLYVTAEHLGQLSLFRVDVESGDAKLLVKEGTISWVGAAKDRVIVAHDTLHRPVELLALTPPSTELRPVTRINERHCATARMGDAEQFTFNGWGGEKVYAYIVKPADFKPGGKYPVAFLIHGGPQGSFGNHFHYRWNPQAYAGAGYAVVMVDFHGSTGYGQAFTDSIRSDWGGKPLEDLKLGLAAALERYPWMDGNRVAALGASYGGYMINWIAGNWPDRFRCLVSHDGNLDERMAYFDTEELWFPEWEHEGVPWEPPNGYGKHNPVDFVGNWKTPMLVIHGGLDFRVVDTQGLSTFTALQRKGIPSKLLHFPDENHWVLKPANSILWHETVIAWLNEWTKPPSP